MQIGDLIRSDKTVILSLPLDTRKQIFGYFIQIYNNSVYYSIEYFIFLEKHTFIGIMIFYIIYYTQLSFKGWYFRFFVHIILLLFPISTSVYY